jgi:hypothetical protein
MYIQVHSGERTCLCELKRCGGDALFTRRCGCSGPSAAPLLVALIVDAHVCGTEASRQATTIPIQARSAMADHDTVDMQAHGGPSPAASAGQSKESSGWLCARAAAHALQVQQVFIIITVICPC